MKAKKLFTFLMMVAVAGTAFTGSFADTTSGQYEGNRCFLKCQKTVRGSASGDDGSGKLWSFEKRLCDRYDRTVTIGGGAETGRSRTEHGNVWDD